MLFIQSEVFPPTVECSLSAATLDHRDSFMSVMKFLKTLLVCPYDKEVSLRICVFMCVCVYMSMCILM